MSFINESPASSSYLTNPATPDGVLSFCFSAILTIIKSRFKKECVEHEQLQKWCVTLIFKKHLLSWIIFINYMTELLEVYDLKGKLIGFKDKKKFYSEIEKELNEKEKYLRK